MFSNQGKSEKQVGAKNSIKSGAGTERRQRQLQKIRSDAHKDALKHFRYTDEDAEGEAGEELNPSGEGIWAYTIHVTSSSLPLTILPECLRVVESRESVVSTRHALLLIRKLLCLKEDTPAETLIQSGGVPLLVKCLYEDDEKIQFEASWCLTNLTAGTAAHSRVVIESQAIPPLVQLLGSPSTKCSDQAAWALGNIAGESAEFRDAIVQHGGLEGLLAVTQNPNATAEVVANATWALSNTYRTKPLLPLNYVAPVLPSLLPLLYHQDASVVTDCCWLVSYLSSGGEDYIDALFSTENCVPRVIELLSSTVVEWKVPAIRIIGNCSAGSELHTESLLKMDILVPLYGLLKETKRSIRKDACWTISNIVLGSPEQARYVMQSGVYEPIVRECLLAPELDVRKESCYCIANLLCFQEAEFYEYLLQLNVLEPLCEALRVGDPKITVVALEALLSFLEYGGALQEATNQPVNPVVQALENCNVLDTLETLQLHKDRDIYDLACTILEDYFGAEAEEPMKNTEAVDFTQVNAGGNDTFNFQ